jgi:hypothetical protein
MTVVRLKGLNEQTVAARMRDARIKSGFNGLYFGGVAFKGQPMYHPKQDSSEDPLPEKAVEVLKHAAKLASHFMDVVTTSGSGTGVACGLGKIRSISEALNGSVLAVSGIAPIASSDMTDTDALRVIQSYYSAGASAFFVATQLSSKCPRHDVMDECPESFCELDVKKVQLFVSRCRIEQKK